MKLSKPERRKDILAKSAALFAERGFRGVTTRELARSAGITEPVLYEHFAAKSDLYRGMIEDLSDAAIEDSLGKLRLVARTGTPKVFFTRLATMMVEYHAANPALMRLLLYSALEGHELARMCFERNASRIFEFLIGYIKEQIGIGTLRKCNPALAARSFAAMITHYYLYEIHFGFRIVRLSRKKAVEGMVDLFLNGIEKQQ